MPRTRKAPATEPAEATSGFQKAPFIRVTREIHDQLKVMSALEHKPMGQLVDEMITKQLTDYFAKKGIKISPR